MDKEKYVYKVFQSIAPGYDRANDRISTGLHLRWKKAGLKALAKKLPEGGSLLDMGCGTGDIIKLIKEQRPDCKALGVDFSPKMLEVAGKNLKGIPGVRLERGNVTRLAYEDGSFDAVTISFALRNTSDYGRVLGEAFRLLKPNGYFMCIDSFVPESPVIRPFYNLYFNLLMPFIGGGIHKHRQYKWLSKSTRDFISAGELMKLMKKKGFCKIRSGGFLFGACVCIMGNKKKIERADNDK